MFVLPKGEKNKLTTEDKTEILKLKGTKSAYAIAEDFNVSHTMIYKIWKKQDGNQKKPNILPGIDTQILKKLIPEFAISKVKIDLSDTEISRIQELAKGVL